MCDSPFAVQCPPRLEDEALLIESGGEMPEVSLAESLAYLEAVDRAGLTCLEAAAARRYFHMVARDLDPENRGAPHFRGLERASANLGRLERFWRRCGWELGGEQAGRLAGLLKQYLAAEAAEIAGGRGYATCRAEEARLLAARLGVDLGPFARALRRMEGLPMLDFVGLAALARLQGAPGPLRRRYGEGAVHIEVLGPDGRVINGARLSLLGVDGPDPEAHERAELVWALASAGRPPAG